MDILNKIKNRVFQKIEVEKEASEAYDIWSAFYDNQPDNLMLYLDGLLFTDLLKKVVLYNKEVVDFGCGTGRHWKTIMARKPRRLLGLDVSAGMLRQLQVKFPKAELGMISDNSLSFIPDGSIDIIISTLTIAHIADCSNLIKSWSRILKPGGDILLTDFHPDVLANGGKRDFHVSGQRIRIKNYVHSIKEIQDLVSINGLSSERLLERQINEDIKHFYVKQNALSVYKKYEGQPIIYGIHIKKL
jgi:ubiquinone/menaquinone biosynthesis C-methylase UbiE